MNVRQEEKNCIYFDEVGGRVGNTGRERRVLPLRNRVDETMLPEI